MVLNSALLVPPKIVQRNIPRPVRASNLLRLEDSYRKEKRGDLGRIWVKVIKCNHISCIYMGNNTCSFSYLPFR
jgi:hypothetical protein